MSIPIEIARLCKKGNLREVRILTNQAHVISTTLI